jgi:hypothetical protein
MRRASTLRFISLRFLAPTTAYEAALCFQRARPLRSGRWAIVLGERASCLIALPIKFAPTSTKLSPTRMARQDFVKCEMADTRS